MPSPLISWNGSSSIAISSITIGRVCKNAYALWRSIAVHNIGLAHLTHIVCNHRLPRTSGPWRWNSICKWTVGVLRCTSDEPSIAFHFSGSLLFQNVFVPWRMRSTTHRSCHSARRRRRYFLHRYACGTLWHDTMWTTSTSLRLLSHAERRRRDTGARHWRHVHVVLSTSVCQSLSSDSELSRGEHISESFHGEADVHFRFAYSRLAQHRTSSTLCRVLVENSTTSARPRSRSAIDYYVSDRRRAPSKQRRTDRSIDT